MNFDEEFTTIMQVNLSSNLDVGGTDIMQNSIIILRVRKKVEIKI